MSWRLAAACLPPSYGSFGCIKGANPGVPTRDCPLDGTLKPKTYNEVQWRYALCTVHGKFMVGFSIGMNGKTNHAKPHGNSNGNGQHVTLWTLLQSFSSRL